MFAFLDSGDIDENPKALKDLYNKRLWNQHSM